MKSKLSHYPYNRPQYEWQKKNIDESFGEYYSKYEAEEVTEEGHYAIREATEEDKSKGYKVALPNKIYSNYYCWLQDYFHATGHKEPLEKVNVYYWDYDRDPTITDQNEEHEFEKTIKIDKLDEIKVEKIYFKEEWSLELKEEMDKYRRIMSHKPNLENPKYRYTFIIEKVPYIRYRLRIEYSTPPYNGWSKITDVIYFHDMLDSVPEDYHSNEYHILSPSNYYGFETDASFKMLEEWAKRVNEDGYYDQGVGSFGVEEGYIFKESNELSLDDIDISLLPQAIKYSTVISSSLHYSALILHDINDNIYYWYNDSSNDYISKLELVYTKNTNNIIYDGLTYYCTYTPQMSIANKPLINTMLPAKHYSLIDQYKSGEYRVNYHPHAWSSKEMYRVPKVAYVLDKYIGVDYHLKDYKGRYKEYNYGDYTVLELLDGNAILKGNYWTDPQYEEIDSGINRFICKKIYEENDYYYELYFYTFTDVKNKNAKNNIIAYQEYGKDSYYLFRRPENWSKQLTRPNETNAFDHCYFLKPGDMLADYKKDEIEYETDDAIYFNDTRYSNNWGIDCITEPRIIYSAGDITQLKEPTYIPDNLIEFIGNDFQLVDNFPANYILDDNKVYFHYDDINKTIFDKEEDYIDLSNLNLYTYKSPESRTYWIHEHNKQYDCVLPDKPIEDKGIYNGAYYEHHEENTNYKYIRKVNGDLVLSETADGEGEPYKPSDPIEAFENIEDSIPYNVEFWQAPLGGSWVFHRWTATEEGYPDILKEDIFVGRANHRGMWYQDVLENSEWHKYESPDDLLNYKYVYKDGAFYMYETRQEQYDYEVLPGDLHDKYWGVWAGKPEPDSTSPIMPKLYALDLTTELDRNTQEGWLKIAWIEDGYLYCYGYNGYSVSEEEWQDEAQPGKWEFRKRLYRYYVAPYKKEYHTYTYITNLKVSPREFNYKVGSYSVLDTLEWIYNDDKNYLPHDDTYDTVNLTMTEYHGIAAELHGSYALDDKDLLDNVEYTKTINDGDSIDFTTVASASITARLNYPIEEANKLVGQNFTYLLDYGDGEWHNMGLFTIDEAESIDAYTSRITGHDHMYRLNKYVDDFIANYKYPTTLGKFWKDLLDYCDIFYEDDTIEGVNADLVLNRNFEAVKTTGLQIAEYISQLMAGYAHIDKDRFSAKIGHYNKKPLIIMPSNYTDLNMSSYSAEIMNQVRLGFNNDKSVIYSGPTTENSVPYYITDNSLIIYNINNEEGYEILRNIMSVIDALPVDYNKAEMKMLTPIVNNEIKVGDIIEVESKLGKRIKMMVMEISIDGSGITYKSFGEAQYPVQGESISSQIIYLNDLQGQISEIRGDGQDTKQELVQISATQTELVNAVNSLNQETIDLGENLVAVDEKYQEITNQITSDHDTDILAVYNAIDAKAEEVKGNAESYADNKDAEILKAAKKYADDQDTTNLQAAKDYADTIKSLIPTGTTMYVDVQDSGVRCDMWIGDADKRSGVKFEYWYKSNPVFINVNFYFNGERVPFTEQIRPGE